MEPHRREQQYSPEPGVEREKKRFRIIRLEERIAPSAGGGTKNCNNQTQHAHTCFCYSGFTCVAGC